MPLPNDTNNGARAVVGVLGNDALGSAYFQSESAKVTVGVFGPKQVNTGDTRKEAKLNITVRMDGHAAVIHGGSVLESSNKRPSDSCRILADAVQQSLRSVILLENLGILQYDITILCHFDFDLVSGFDAVLTASGLACADAGLQMIDLISSTTVLLSPQNHILKDVAEGNRDSAAGILRIVSTTNTKEIIYFNLSGSRWGSCSDVSFKRPVDETAQNNSLLPPEESIAHAVDFCIHANSSKNSFLTACFYG